MLFVLNFVSPFSYISEAEAYLVGNGNTCNTQWLICVLVFLMNFWIVFARCGRWCWRKRGMRGSCLVFLPLETLLELPLASWTGFREFWPAFLLVLLAFFVILEHRQSSQEKDIRRIGLHRLALFPVSKVITQPKVWLDQPWLCERSHYAHFLGGQSLGEVDVCDWRPMEAETRAQYSQRRGWIPLHSSLQTLILVVGY